ncbi:MAG: UvrD-helicase domain-containing protein [Candidatus Didemnitutus sp.]|nr:UvrD-helicase domain-containing protein [Candidatus Didemnitutus sp.]
MNSAPIDHASRDRFCRELHVNFAVSANAGSGKTTAISHRLAELALAPDGAELLRKTAVVTFTKKAAAQIGQKARAVLLQRLSEEQHAGLAPLDHLERAFFGTIHSFCLLLAQRHGQTLGLNLNPTVVAEEDEMLWEEFLEQDTMQFSALGSKQVDAFLRHTPLDSIFDLARRLAHEKARELVATSPSAMPPEPSAGALEAILAAQSRGKGAESLRRNQATAQTWLQRFRVEHGYLALPKPQGTAAKIGPLFTAFLAPVKDWMAEAGAVLAAELALRYREWRFERGVQTYADQVESAVAVLHDEETLERIRLEGWRIILDEAQDTDPQQFAVLVEIARPRGATLGSWPSGGGPGPRPGHFCMVGDGQQAIYGSRADIRNFQKHLDAFARGDGGRLETFDVTFRTPHRVIELLNATLPAAFSADRPHSLGLPLAEGVAGPLLQVGYGRLKAGPKNAEGQCVVLPLTSAGEKLKVEVQLAAEVKQVAAILRRHGPAGVGARHWGELCVIAPRNDWLLTARKELEAAGLKTSLQMRKNRNGDNPVFAWLTGLLAAVCDPQNTFEWVGVLREVFAISDAQIAAELSRQQHKFVWDEPVRHAEPLRGALEVLQRFVAQVDDEGRTLESFAHDLVDTCQLARKARLVDPSGALNVELERLLAQASELGLEGTGPRGWLAELLRQLEEGRPAGKPSEDAINLLTSHSAKGLEWPVVIPVGLWRTIGKREETGLRMINDAGGGSRVYFDNDSLPEEAKEARERERLRELVRLLYVTLTRARQTLVLPWGADFVRPGKGSFLDLWAAELGGLLCLEEGVLGPRPPDPAVPTVPQLARERISFGGVTFPRRVLPHQLSHRPDIVRSVRHESAAEEPVPWLNLIDPLDYGKWWHETVEFLPWSGTEAEIAQHLDQALAVAETGGFAVRARAEVGLLKNSDAWRELRSGRWRILAEVSIVAPMGGAAWVDGVVDLVAHDAVAGRLLVVDWKTNLRATGESVAMFRERLRGEYAPQLEAYRQCLKPFFPRSGVEVAVYATNAGVWETW